MMGGWEDGGEWESDDLAWLSLIGSLVLKYIGIPSFFLVPCLVFSLFLHRFFCLHGGFLFLFHVVWVCVSGPATAMTSGEREENHPIPVCNFRAD